MSHISSCVCGQLSLTYTGEITSTSICHCYSCQKRTGSVFGAQFGVSADLVTIEGQSKVYLYTGDEGSKASMHFCPDCGSTLLWSRVEEPSKLTVAVGGFADRSLPSPTVSVYGKTRKHHWVELPDTVEKHWG